MNPELLRISVVVPVFNHWELIPGLIERLALQSIGTDRVELLLVDNGSDHVPPPVDEPDFVRRLVCHDPGSYAARNYGAANAQGDILAFTDADCLPGPDWLEALLTMFAANGMERVIVAGGVSVIADAPLTMAARYDMALGFPQEQYVARGYGVTANLALSRKLFEQSGGFDAHRLSGGDAEFCLRVAARLGVMTVYCPNAVVNHPARRSMTELVRKVRRLKGGQLRNGPLRQRTLYALRGFAPPVRAWWRIGSSSRLGFRGKIIVSFVQMLLWLAEMAETIRLLSGFPAERR